MHAERMFQQDDAADDGDVHAAEDARTALLHHAHAPDPCDTPPHGAHAHREHPHAQGPTHFSASVGAYFSRAWTVSACAWLGLAATVAVLLGSVVWLAAATALSRAADTVSNGYWTLPSQQHMCAFLMRLHSAWEMH